MTRVPENTLIGSVLRPPETLSKAVQSSGKGKNMQALTTDSREDMVFKRKAVALCLRDSVKQ